MNKLLLIISLSCCLFFYSVTDAEIYNETPDWENLRALLAEKKVLADPLDAGSNQRFGNAVSVSGNRILIGAINDNLNGAASGSAYVFDYIGNEWFQTQKLTNDDAATSDEFGASVSLDQDRLLVGARSKTVDGVSFAGAVYVFELINGVWEQTEKLTSNPLLGTAQFGYSVSLSGNSALIGAPSNGAGEVFVFTLDDQNNQWFQSNTLSANSQGFGDRFGHSVSLYQGRALIGANRFESSNIGAAFYFGSVSINNDQIQITPSDGMSGDNFGYSVSLFENRALIGAPEDSGINGTDSGSAYIFDLDTVNGLWVETDKLTANDAAANDEFGHSVSLNGDKVLIGAWGDDDGGSNSGSAYFYDFDGVFWNQSDKLTPVDGSSSQEYGRSVFLTDSWALVGAPKDSENIGLAGAAYSYQEDIIFIGHFDQ